MISLFRTGRAAVMSMLLAAVSACELKTHTERYYFEGYRTQGTEWRVEPGIMPLEQRVVRKIETIVGRQYSLGKPEFDYANNLVRIPVSVTGDLKTTTFIEQRVPTHEVVLLDDIHSPRSIERRTGKTGSKVRTIEESAMEPMRHPVPVQDGAVYANATHAIPVKNGVATISLLPFGYVLTGSPEQLDKEVARVAGLIKPSCRPKGLYEKIRGALAGGVFELSVRYENDEQARASLKIPAYPLGGYFLRDIVDAVIEKGYRSLRVEEVGVFFQERVHFPNRVVVRSNPYIDAEVRVTPLNVPKRNKLIGRCFGNDASLREIVEARFPTYQDTPFEGSGDEVMFNAYLPSSYRMTVSFGRSKRAYALHFSAGKLQEHIAVRDVW